MKLNPCWRAIRSRESVVIPRKVHRILSVWWHISSPEWTSCGNSGIAKLSAQPAAGAHDPHECDSTAGISSDAKRKINRRALPAPEAVEKETDQSIENSTAPRNEWEKSGRIWRRILRTRRYPYRIIFSPGGHSLGTSTGICHQARI